MKLWIDGQCFQTASRMRGIGRYVDEFIHELVEGHPEIDVHVSLNGALAQQAADARAFLMSRIPASNIHVWHGAVQGYEQHYGYDDRRKLSEIALGYHVAKIAPDIALSASPFEDGGAVPFVTNSIADLPTAGIFYDAIPMRFEDKYLQDDGQKNYFYRRLKFYKLYDVNLCISDFSRKELTEINKLDSCVNIAAGFSRKFLSILEEENKANRDDCSLLYVGGFDWRKNVPRVIEAVALLSPPLRDRLVLVVVGDLPVGVDVDLMTMWERSHLPSGHLKLVGRVSDSRLVRYYQEVSAVIQPSLMEGFGLTALEAILCDTPVVASRAGALPEIVIDKNRLFDPEDVVAISDCLQTLFDDLESGREVISPEAKAHARSFTWAATVNRAIEAMNEVVNKSAHTGPRQTVDALEAKVLARVRELKLPQSMIAGCLARAETNTTSSRRLIVDATATIISNAGSGIQRVVGKICNSLPEMTPPDVETLVAFSDSTQWLAVPDNNIVTDAQAVKSRAKSLKFGPGDQVLMLDSSWGYYHEHAQSLRGARIVGAQITSCLYDFTPLNAPGFATNAIPVIFTHWLKAALQYSTGFVCISKAVADELITFLEAIAFPRPMKIAYWPLGADFAEDGQTPRLEAPKGRSQRPRFLMVGTIEPRKGHRLALEAFDLLWSQGVDVELVIVGRMGWNANLMVDKLEAHREWKKRLVWDANASDSRLQQYYAEADCLVAASFAEGYGLPIAEASHFRKPIIASDIPVFREVAGESMGAIFFEPGSAEGLSLAVRQFIKSTGTLDVTEAIPRKTWRESAEALQQLVLGDDWYHQYVPKEEDYFHSSFDAGTLSMKGALDAAQSEHRLTLQDGPLSAEDHELVRFVVKIENLSGAVWTSNGMTSGQNAIHLACRLFDERGQLILDGPRTRIPIAIFSRSTVYYPLEVPKKWKVHPNAFIHFEMVQEGVSWWGNPVILPTSMLVADMTNGTV